MEIQESSQNEKPQLWPQYLAGLTAILLALNCGIHFGWPSPAIPKLKERELQFNVSAKEISYMVMVSPLGYLVGCPVSAILLDKIGRKPSILILAIPQIISCLMIANATGMVMLYLSRILSGVSGGGALTTVPVYLCEISEAKIRGALGSGYAVGVVFGALLINCYGSYMHLRSSAYISLCFPFVFLGTFVWMPESPYYFIMKNRIEDARESLKKLKKINNVDKELNMLMVHYAEDNREPKRALDIFTVKYNLRAFLIVIGLRTLQQFTGGSSINIYNQMIFQEANGSFSFVVSSIIYNAVSVVVAACCSLVVDCWGRRPLMICSTTATGICLFIEGLYFYFKCYNYDVSKFRWVPITAMVLYIIARAVGLMPIPTLIAGELFSATTKAKAMGMVNIYVALSFSFSTKVFQMLADSFGMYSPFFVYVFCCLVGILFIHYCVPETKQRTLEEIQIKLKGTS